MKEKIIKYSVILTLSILVCFFNINSLKAKSYDPYTYYTYTNYAGEKTKIKHTVNYDTLEETISYEKGNSQGGTTITETEPLEDVKVFYMSSQFIVEGMNYISQAYNYLSDPFVVVNGEKLLYPNFFRNYNGIYYYSHYSNKIVPLQPYGLGDNANQPVDKVFDIRFDTTFFGGEDIAKSVCEKYCAISCVQNSGRTLNKDYFCGTDDLKTVFFPELEYHTFSWSKREDPNIDSRGSIKIVKDDLEDPRYPPILLSGENKCVNFVTSKNEYEKYWICESNLDAEKSCYGGVRKNDSSRRDAVEVIDPYTCWGNRRPNVYIADPNGKYVIDGVNYIKADEMPWETDSSVLKDMDDKTINKNGDKIQATLYGITNIMYGKVDCEGALGDTADLLREIFGYVRIGSIILLIVLSAIDYIKAITSAEEGALKASNSSFIKRLIVTIAIFIVPVIIQFILAIVQLEQGLCGLEKM